MPETQFAVSGAARIAYDVAGSGEAVVLLHAGLGDRSMWDAQIPALSSRYRVIRLDMRGFGDTIKPNEPYESWNDVVAVLDHEGVSSAHVIGISMGSGVAADLAVMAPDRVRTLTLVGSNVGSAAPQALIDEWNHVDELYESEGVDAAVEYELKMWIDGPDRRPADIDPTFRERVRVMNRALFLREDTEGEQIPRDPADHLPSLAMPTLILWGAKDMHHIRAAGPKLATLIASARSVVMQNASHLPNMEHPDEFNEIILSFLARY